MFKFVAIFAVCLACWMAFKAINHYLYRQYCKKILRAVKGELKIDPSLDHIMSSPACCGSFQFRAKISEAAESYIKSVSFVARKREALNRVA